MDGHDGERVGGGIGWLIVVVLLLVMILSLMTRPSQCTVDVDVISDSLLHETIVAQRDTIEMLRESCNRRWLRVEP